MSKKELPAVGDTAWSRVVAFARRVMQDWYAYEALRLSLMATLPILKGDEPFKETNMGQSNATSSRWRGARR